MINWSGGQWENLYINQYFHEACFSSWSNRGVYMVLRMVGTVKLGNDGTVTTLNISNVSFVPMLVCNYVVSLEVYF